MFIKFEFENFRSFRDRQVFTMEAMPLRPNDDGMSEGNVFEAGGVRLLKTKAIYGSNASGKSNVTKAIGAFHMMVSRSVAEERLPEQIWNERFQLITDWDDQPVYFQYHFLYENIIYRYGFQVLENVISYEWLYSGVKEQETEFFMRGPSGLVVNQHAFPAADQLFMHNWQEENELYRPDSLFLTAAALNSNKLLAKLRIEIRNIMNVHGVYDSLSIRFAMDNFINGPKEKKQALIALLAAADTGIEDLDIDELPDRLVTRIKNEMGDNGDQKVISLFSTHSIFDWDGNRQKTKVVPFGEWESEGSGKIFSIGALVLDALSKGRTIAIDEFDARLHPNLSLKIVELFQDKKTNPKNAQLIFVTHDSGLLRRADLRRDQICFINKDRFGISSAVNLIDFKGVRKDASYEKEYLNGTYTGIPYLDKIDQVVITANQANGLQEAK